MCLLGNVGTKSRDLLKTYVEKHTIMYAYFRVPTNKIFIIISTEVPAYLKTSPGKICVPIVFQVLSSVVPWNENSRDRPMGFCLGKMEFAPTKISSQENCWGETIHSNNKIHSNTKI